MLEALQAFFAQYGDLLWQETIDTLIMVTVTTLFAYVLGLPLGVLLNITRPDGIWPHKGFNSVVGWITNLGRSLPFLILMILLLDFTKLIVGTKIGVLGAIPPLIISATPFVARMVETSLAEVDSGVQEAAQSMGATVPQIVFKVLLPEAMPSLMLGGSISMVTILAYTAIAGVIGAGGLGDLAIRYGYNRKVASMMWASVIILVIMVQIIQSVFSFVSRKIDKRIRL